MLAYTRGKECPTQTLLTSDCKTANLQRGRCDFKKYAYLPSSASASSTPYAGRTPAFSGMHDHRAADDDRFALPRGLGALGGGAGGGGDGGMFDLLALGAGDNDNRPARLSADDCFCGCPHCLQVWYGRLLTDASFLDVRSVVVARQTADAIRQSCFQISLCCLFSEACPSVLCCVRLFPMVRIRAMYWLCSD